MPNAVKIGRGVPVMIQMFALFLAYFATAKLGLTLGAVNGFATLVWPPAGIALAVLFLAGTRMWPAVFLGAMLVNYSIGASIPASIGIGVGNALEAVAGAYLLRRWIGFSPSLERLRDVLGLFFLPVVLCTMISATIGVASLWLGGGLSYSSVWMTWRAWWVGDALGCLVVAPLLMVLTTYRWTRPRLTRVLEAIGLSTGMVGVVMVVFWSDPEAKLFLYPVTFLIFPFIIWTALSFGQVGTVITSFFISVCTILGTARGFGPFAGENLSESLLFLQGFQAVATLTGMVLAAVTAERRKANIDLRRSWSELERKVLERTEALRVSELRFRSLVEGVKDYAILMLDPHGTVVSWNEGAARITGYSSTEIIGRHFSVFYPSFENAQGKSTWELREAERLGRFEDEGYRARRDGKLFYANVVVAPLRDTEGRLVGFSKITRDLTERKRAEDALRSAHDELETRVKSRTAELAQSRDQLSVILRGISDGITVHNQEGRIIYANEAAAGILGFDSLAELLAGPPGLLPEQFDIFDEEGRPLPEGSSPVQLALSGIKDLPEVVVQFRSKRKHHERWSLVRSTPVYDEAGNVCLAVSIFKDFTERKRAEDALKYLDETTKLLSSSLDYESTFSDVVHQAVPGLADWCVVTMLTESRSLQQLAVAHVDPAKAQLANDLEQRYPMSIDAQAGIPHVIRTGVSVLHSDISSELLASISRSEEHYQFLRGMNLRSLMIVPLKARNQTLGAITLITAESGRRYTAQDLALAEELGVRAGIAVDNAKLYRQAQKAIQARDEFMSIASHELKTPLTPLLLQLQMVRMTTEKVFASLQSSTQGEQNDTSVLPLGRAAQMLGKCEAHTRKLIELIDQLMDITRIRIGKLELKPQDVDLEELVRDVIDRFSTDTKRTGSKISFSTQGRVRGVWDQARMDQVVTNLVSNAIKYGAGKPIEIVLGTNGAFARLMVRDHGVGMLPEEQGRIFDRFERAVSGKNVSGLGLGLFIAGQIVSAHGGRITVSSQVGLGSTFTVEVPLKRPMRAAVTTVDLVS